MHIMQYLCSISSELSLAMPCHAIPLILLPVNLKVHEHEQVVSVPIHGLHHVATFLQMTSSDLMSFLFDYITSAPMRVYIALLSA